MAYLLNIILLIISFRGTDASAGKYLFHDTQDAGSSAAVIQMLQVMDRTLDHLATLELSSIVVELEIVIARANLEYILGKMASEAEHDVMEGPIVDVIIKLKNTSRNLNIHYVTPDVAKSMKIFSKHQGRFKSTLQPMTIGHIGYHQPLTMLEESYRSIIVRQENLYNKTDRCLQKLLDYGNEISTNSRPCTVDVACYDYFMRRGNYGLFLVQAGTYVMVAKYFGCAPKRADDDIVRLCETMYEELLSIEQYGFTDHLAEVFGLQMSFCGSMGVGEFVKPRWIKLLLSWEGAPGVFRNPGSSRRDHSILSAEMIGCLAVYVRAMLAAD